jgi:VanZ family protein
MIDLDNFVHACMFFVLALLLANAFRVKGTPTRYLLWAVVISILYGVGTEFMQGLEAMGRRTDPLDMIANTAGALLAAWFATWSLRKGRNFIPFTFLR